MHTSPTGPSPWHTAHATLLPPGSVSRWTYSSASSDVVTVPCRDMAGSERNAERTAAASSVWSGRRGGRRGDDIGGPGGAGTDIGPDGRHSWDAENDHITP